MLCLPAKTTSNKVDWASSLSKYVARAYSKAQAEAHKEQFRRVDELRRQVAAAAEARLEERTAADARALYVRYYKLLCSMEQRFEVAEADLRNFAALSHAATAVNIDDGGAIVATTEGKRAAVSATSKATISQLADRFCAAIQRNGKSAASVWQVRRHLHLHGHCVVPDFFLVFLKYVYNI